MRKIIQILLILFGFGITLNATPKGCYEIYKLDKQNIIDTAIFVLIDETTLFDQNLKDQIISNALSFVESSNHIYIGKFSALIGGKYNETLFDFSLDTHLSNQERYDINKSMLNKIDKCLNDQIGFVRKNTKKSIEGSFGTNDIAKSDILYALKDFAKSVIAPLNAKRKIVILASDMLENSAITSFYANNAVRQIDSNKELSIVAKNDLFADFGGAEVFIIGAGISSKKSYVNPKMLASLTNFWQEYFAKSNATLKNIGTPALKSAIR
ncbi:hypothetical protein [Helicobacter winghamensis]|uniref:VWFA domain-containing protein n=1 Tax=Helicobacter winghamensis TaxID=157268 RepID=A0A2N3PHP1_9HELI|nr:hypothetical protein [Helicobacter winghamensis]PKT78329.1 hypothetical protein BCM32_01075 [Helicobacter winghamensis]PKT80079.1 hypothetical protein BCM31_00065 [Helicobacter winghamensis]PKT80184.1 hypothetical protein BCM33_03135 [Helicobacter winghamensis]